jgi:hypothetical protein
MLVMVFGCVESDIVRRFSSDQIEQLLTDGATKTWYQTDFVIDGQRESVESCSDSVRWVFEVVEADSISSYELRFDNQCLFYDTTFFGAFSPSDFEGAFTDSLKFEGGSMDFMKLRYIRASVFSVSYKVKGEEITATFDAINTQYLPRQVSAILSGGNAPQDSAQWQLVSLREDGVNRPFTYCSDSTILQFARSQSGVFLSELIAADTTCISYEKSTLGQVTAGQSADGFFDGTLYLSDGSVNEMTFTVFDERAFTAQFEREGSSYTASYILLD